MVYLNDACVEALQLYLNKRNVMEGLSPKERTLSNFFFLISTLYKI
jgi:hypothetical protein